MMMVSISLLLGPIIDRYSNRYATFDGWHFPVGLQAFAAFRSGVGHRRVPSAACNSRASHANVTAGRRVSAGEKSPA
jgi:hypothetical protein